MNISAILFILGILVAFGSFIFAAINMALGAKRFLSGGNDNFGSMFTGHIGAMIGMAVGGLVATIGALTGGWAIFQSYILPYIQK